MQSWKTYTIVFASWLICFCGTSDANAQDHYARVQASLVHLTAEGTNEETGETAKTEANGILTSSDGSILTNYHIIQKLGNVSQKSIVFTARIGSKSAQGRNAVLIAHNAANDLLRLKITDTYGLEGPITPVTFISPKELKEKFVQTTAIFTKPIYSVSFVKGVEDFVRVDGRVSSLSGPSGYLWVTSMRFADGQSGSPIFFEDGRVLGIVKGDSLTAEVGYFIPTEHAYTIEPGVRDADLDYILPKVTANADPEVEALKSAFEGLRASFNAKVEELPNIYKALERQNYVKDKLSLSRQMLAQAICVAQAPNGREHSTVFAVPRRCSKTNAETCATLCKTALSTAAASAGQPADNLRCVDSYFVPGDADGGAPADQNDKLGLKTIKYGRCNVKASNSDCGPNFCCCAVARGGAR